mgnify:FL=1
MRHKLIQLLTSALLFNAVISSTLSAEESVNYVESTKYQVTKNQALIEIKFSKKINYKHDQLKSPYRIYFDIEVKTLTPT